MRRLLLFLVALVVVAIPSPALATAPVDTAGTTADDAAPTTTTVLGAIDTTADTTTDTTIDNGFLDTERDLTECLNNSIQLPGCGSEPTEEGDRGGALQLATFGVLTLGIAFICWRVARGIKARDAAIAERSR